MTNRRDTYDFCAPQYFDFPITKIADRVSAHLDSFNISCVSNGNMEVDVKSPLPTLSGRASSTPKRDCCTQTPIRTDQEETLLSEALEALLNLGRPTRRSVRFSDKVRVYQHPSASPEPQKDAPNKKTDSAVQTEETDEENTLKRATTPVCGQSWHQALKYRRVEQRVATPRFAARKSSTRGSLSGSRIPLPDPRPTSNTVTPNRPKTVDVRMRVIQKPQVKVEPFKLTEYKPRQVPLEDPTEVFQKYKNTPGRLADPKTAVRRLADNQQESPKTPQFRARPPVSLYRSPFVPKLCEKPATVPEPFVLHTEKRAKERELFDQRIMEHQLELENARRRLAEERERHEAQELKELRRVKFHARPVPAFIYQYQLPTSKTPDNPERPALNRRKTQSLTPK